MSGTSEHILEGRTLNRIVIAGYFGYGNTGDEAVLIGMLRDLRAVDPSLDFVVVSGDPDQTQALHGVGSVLSADVAGIAEEVRQSDLVILGGGGLFQDYWLADPGSMLTPKHAGLSFYAGIPLLATLLGKPCMLYAVGVGPLESEESRRLTSAAFELAQCATVRDAESLRVLQEIGLDRQPTWMGVKVTADPAFNLPFASLEIARAFLRNAGVDQDEHLLGVCLRNWDFGVDPVRWEGEVAQALDMFLDERSGHVLFLPFQQRVGWRYEEDLFVSQRVLNAMRHKDRASLFKSPLSAPVAAAVLSQCELVLAMRMHAALFAICACVPVVALAYDPKTHALMKRAGLEDLSVPKEDWQSGTLIERLRISNDVTNRRRLADFTEKMSLLASENAQIAIDLMQKGPSDLPASECYMREVSLDRVLRNVDLEKLVALTTADLEKQVALTSTVQDQRDLLLIERNKLERELSMLRDTLGVRILTKYWDLVRRAFPEGSRRRYFYRLLRSFFRRFRVASANYSSSSTNVSQVEPLALVETSESLHSIWDLNNTQIREEHHWELHKFLEQVREPESKYVVVIFSPTQLIEDEGQRPTNLAREMSRRGYRVIFAYWRWRKDQWRPQNRLDEGIFQIPIDLIVDRPDTLFHDFDGAQGIAFFEFPHPAFFGLLASANSSGWVTVYDCVDDWQEFHRVGQANWYERNFEKHMVATTDAVYAVNERIAARIRSLGRESVEIVPNGFRWGIDQVDDVRRLVRGKVTLGYFGYLSGAWFDWKFIAEVARTEPEWRIYLIGYGGGPEGMTLPPNIVLLGRKPQSSLASYAANWDLAIVPFKTERLAASADPIKIYEYLAMGLPVVTTGVYPPPGAERFVLQAEGVKDFIEKVEMASTWREEGVEERRAYLASCTWSHRVDAILGSVITGHQRIAEKRALFTMKP